MIAKIISLIFKAVAKNKIEREVVNDLLGISIDHYTEKAINFIEEKKSQIDYILSKENMKDMHISESNIDYVEAEIKDIFGKVDINDEVLKQHGYNKETLSEFLWDKYCELSECNIECESDIKKGISAVAGTLIDVKLDSSEFVKDILIQINNTVDETGIEVKKMLISLGDKLDKMDKNDLKILEQLQKPDKQDGGTVGIVKSRTAEYARKWDENMFLNNFDKRDENAGANVKLSEVYLDEHLPHYKWKNNTGISTDTRGLLSEYIDINGKRMALILGQPGIGKSTLITWLIANFGKFVDNILVYQFASDLKNIKWDNVSKNYDITDELLKELNLRNDILDGKILILDGFDEISVEKDRAEILNQLYWKLIKKNTLNNFSLIITCRENYILNLHRVECDYITLQAWDKRQIKSFCQVYQNKINGSISEKAMDSILENSEILGIPLILYMVLALNISIESFLYTLNRSRN